MGKRRGREREREEILAPPPPPSIKPGCAGEKEDHWVEVGEWRERMREEHEIEERSELTIKNGASTKDSKRKELIGQGMLMRCN